MNKKIIAVLAAAALAFGYMVMNIFPVSGNVSGDVCSTLFGSTSILTLELKDVYLCLALSAIRVFRSFFSVTVCSAVVAVLSSFSGIIVSILAGTPVGSTIVAVQALVFALFCMLPAGIGI